MIDTVIIPAAGLGTRLLTATKESPKEMVPLFDRVNNVVIVRPLIERIFLQMYDSGIRNFYFIVGKKKRAIEDHFTPEKNYFHSTSGQNKEIFKEIIEDFYHKIEQSNIVWINQNSPKGFGAAVLSTWDVLGNRPFLVHAGDAFIRGNQEHISNLITSHDKIKSDVLLYLHEIKNPKEYGVAEAEEIGNGIFKVIKVEEKPKQPKSNFALMPLYAFNYTFFDSLSQTKPGLRDELQLTDGIQTMIDSGAKVNAIFFKNADDCIDIGTPQNYFRALQISFKDSENKH